MFIFAAVNYDFNRPKLQGCARPMETQRPLAPKRHRVAHEQGTGKVGAFPCKSSGMGGGGWDSAGRAVLMGVTTQALTCGFYSESGSLQGIPVACTPLSRCKEQW